MSTATHVTAPSHREPAFDGLRGLAVTLVFLFHYGGGLTSHNPLLRAFGHLTAAGWTGVQLFFVLSGFLITGILWNSQQAELPHHLRNFYMRRILRIVPLTWVAITLSFAFCLAMGSSPRDLHGFLYEYLFLQDIPGLVRFIEHVQKIPLFHLWTIAVEEQFYILWPLLLLLCGRSRRAAQTLCLIVLAASLAENALFVLHPGLISADVQQRSLLTFAGALALGGWLALTLGGRSTKIKQTIKQLALPVFLMGLATFIGSSLFHGSFLLRGRQYAAGLLPIWLASAGLLVLLLSPGRLHTFFSNPVLRFIGHYSFGFYIFHILLEPLYSHLTFAIVHCYNGYAFLGTRLVLAYLLTLVFAWISYQLLEFPFLKLKHHFPSAPAIAP